MPTKQFKPMTPGTRFRQTNDFSEVTHQGRPEKSLTEALTKSGGRNHHGHVTSRRRGGGHKRLYRVVDFKRNKPGVAGKVERIEYDPNRTSNIALVVYEDGERRYILAPRGLKEGDRIEQGSGADIRVGNALPLAEVPLGTTVHNVELRAGKGGQMARSAGASVQVVAKEGDYVSVKM
ncbi:MAG TPA: 50S ribosomal protein L2, partial [Longimicrobium sp.]|nr:50S ribosomal protein L2 [Longimicrobium sp.]